MWSSRPHLLGTLLAGIVALGGCATQPRPHPKASLPDLPLRTHEGTRVRFYEDLIRGKTVLVNFMYTSCDGL